jgi:hypothetical protein
MKNGMKTIEVQGGNKYIMVNERVKFFHDQYPKGAIRSELVEMTDRVIVKTFVYPDANDELRYFTGFAYEMVGSSFINKTSALENCETSSVGRALGFLGIGIDTSIASKEEVENAIHQQDQPEYTITDEQKDAYQKLLESDYYKGGKAKMNDWWGKLVTFEQARTGLVAMKGQVEKYETKQAEIKAKKEAKKKEVA